MKTDQGKRDAKGRPRIEPFKDQFKNGTVFCTARIRDGEGDGLTGHPDEHERMDYTSHA